MDCLDRSLARSLLVTLLVSPFLAWTWSIFCAFIGSRPFAWEYIDAHSGGDSVWLPSQHGTTVVHEQMRTFVILRFELRPDATVDASRQAWSNAVARWNHRDAASVIPSMPSDPPAWSQLMVVASGWPAPAVWDGRRVASDSQNLDANRVIYRLSGRVWNEPWQSLGLYPDRTPTNFPSFPWRPLWPGFLINTGVVWGVLLVIAVCRLWILRARDRRRLARGLCPSCRYDIAALPPDAEARTTCPECGGVWNAR